MVHVLIYFSVKLKSWEELFMWKINFLYGCPILRGMAFRKAANITRLTIVMRVLHTLQLYKFWIKFFRKINVWADGDIYLREAEFIIWLELGISSSCLKMRTHFLWRITYVWGKLSLFSKFKAIPHVVCVRGVFGGCVWIHLWKNLINNGQELIWWNSLVSS